MDRDAPAIAGQMHSFAGEALLLELAFQALLKAFGEIGRIHILNIHFQQLVTGIAQALAGRLVAVQDPARGVVQEDTVIDALKDGAQALFAFAQDLLGIAGTLVEFGVFQRDSSLGHQHLERGQALGGEHPGAEIVFQPEDPLRVSPCWTGMHSTERGWHRRTYSLSRKRPSVVASASTRGTARR